MVIVTEQGKNHNYLLRLDASCTVGKLIECNLSMSILALTDASLTDASLTDASIYKRLYKHYDLINAQTP